MVRFHIILERYLLFQVRIPYQFEVLVNESKRFGT